MELADGVLVNKADGDLEAAADRAAQQCLLAMRVLHAGDGGPPPVLVGSATTGRGLAELWRSIERRLDDARRSGRLAERRARQAEQWLETAVREALLDEFLRDGRVRAAMHAATAKVAAGERLPRAVARDLIRLRDRP